MAILDQAPDRASHEPGPDERAELAELAATVRAAVAQLADGQRDAVFLFYLQGLTHREVAAELAISVGAVKARLHQARAALTPALVPLASGPAPTSGPAGPATRTKEPVMTTTAGRPAWAEVTVTDIRCSDDADPSNRQHIILLDERDGARRLPIWVGPTEATVLAMSLQAVETPRPLTYQMTASLLDACGSRVSEVRITRLAGEVFYAVVIVDGPAGQREVDARPSDAINLALVTGAPILADSALLDDPRASRRDEWQDLPSGTAALAAEADGVEAAVRADGLTACRARGAGPGATVGSPARPGSTTAAGRQRRSRLTIVVSSVGQGTSWANQYASTSGMITRKIAIRP